VFQSIISEDTAHTGETEIAYKILVEIPDKKRLLPRNILLHVTIILILILKE
jgi:hypothetical protein